MRSKAIQIIALLVFLYLLCMVADAKTDCTYMIDSGYCYKVEATAYCDAEQPTASGELVRDGICAFAPELMHKTVYIWTEDWELIGIYEVKDTGSKRIKNGEVIDIWMQDYNDCIQFGRQKVWIQVLDAQG